VVGSTVVAATEKDSVYALDLVTGKIRWRIHLGTAVSLSSLPCGNIDPLGITGTPVYDPATRQVFVVAEASGPRHVLAAIRLADGRVAWTREVERPGGDPRVHQQRAALALGNGLVYVAFGGLEGDCGPYIGTVVAVLTNGQGAPHVWTVPTPREGGIWAPPGPVIDPSGAVYVAVGNGESTKAYDGSDSVTKLSPTLARIDFFAPSRWAQENAQDADLGSASPALVGGYVFQAGKGGVGYLLSPAHLGGIGGELASIDLHCRSFGGDAVVGHVVYLPCEDGVRAVEVASGPSLRQLWRSAHAVNGPPVVGGGVVWALDSHAGVLYVLDQASGRTRTTLRVGSLPHFASPTLSGGRALIGTTSGVVCLTGA
jgi:outer membrane protein assembly factor BamB